MTLRIPAANNSGVVGHQLKLHEAVDLMKRFGFLALYEERFCIQLSFLLEGKNCSFQQRYELFCYIQSKLEQLMSDFMQASTATKAYVPCFYPECNKLHVQLQLLCDGKYQHCPTVEKPIPDDYYCDLFSDQGLD